MLVPCVGFVSSGGSWVLVSCVGFVSWGCSWVFILCGEAVLGRWFRVLVFCLICVFTRRRSEESWQVGKVGVGNYLH